MFVVWGHGTEKLNDFLEHINNIHPSIQFNTEVERRKTVFLDVLVIRKEDRLGHTVYRKWTPTDRYLHNSSNHHLSQKQGIIKTLADQARRLCEPGNLGQSSWIGTYTQRIHKRKRKKRKRQRRRPFYHKNQVLRTGSNDYKYFSIDMKIILK